MIFYNEVKNPAKIKFDLKKPNTLCVSVSNSKGWVRLIKPVSLNNSASRYSLELVTRALTSDGKSHIEPMIFLESNKGKFVKHAKFKLVDGKYKTQINKITDDSKLWVGFETTEEQIDLFVNHIQLEVTEVQEDLAQSHITCKKLTIPIVESQAKSENYKKIIGHNTLYSEYIKANEFNFLLEYASCLRRVEMPITYQNIIRYLVLKHDKFDEKQQKHLLQHIKNVLTISHDTKLVKLLMSNCPELIFKLDINEELFEQIMNLPAGSTKNPTTGPQQTGLYKHQIDNSNLISFIKNEVHIDKSYFDKRPHAYCALANVYRGENNNSFYYRNFVNSYLDNYKLPNISDINLSKSNVLSSVKFEKCSTVEYGPLVSIIMSAHNAEDSIEYAMNSILNQTYKNIELLVCDDKSTDETLNIAKKVAANNSRVRVFQSKENQGTYNIRNDLINASKGEFISFQDSDDLALPVRVQNQIQSLAKDDSLVCFSNWARIRPDGAFVFFHDGLLNRFCVVSAMAHRSVFERLPNFRSVLVAADTEFYELCKNYLGENQISILKSPLIFGLWGEGSLTQRKSLTAEHNGFVAERRRTYAEIAARQRLLGSIIISDDDVDDVLQELDIYRDAKGSIELTSTEK